jgi:hypothetical protein
MSVSDAITVGEHDGFAPDNLDVEVLLHFGSGAAVEVRLTAEQKRQLLALARAEKSWPTSLAVVTTRRPSGCGVMLIYDRRAGDGDE